MEFLTGYAAFHWIEPWSTPWLDVLFRLITDLGSPLFYFFVIAPLFWVVDRRRALVLFLLLLLAALINTEAKLFWNTPRPDPSLIRVLDLRPIQSGSPSFPSGHAQIAIVFWGYLVLWAGRRSATLVGVGVIAAISFSRIYLGAHFPGDVLGGLLLGAALFAAVPWLERWAAAEFPAPLILRLAACVALVALMLLSTDASNILVFGCLLAFVLLVSLPVAPLSLSRPAHGIAVVFAGIALQLLCLALFGQFSPGSINAGAGLRVAALWLIALWLYPHAVAAVLARRGVSAVE